MKDDKTSPPLYVLAVEVVETDDFSPVIVRTASGQLLRWGGAVHVARVREGTCWAILLSAQEA